MEIPVLVEPLPNNRFRARCGEPFALSAEGDTHAEAMKCLDSLVNQRLANGAKLQLIRVDALPDNPWKSLAGVWTDDREIDEWKRLVADNRAKRNATQGLP